MFVCIVAFGVVPFAGKTKASSRAFASQKALLDLIETRIEEIRGFQDGHSELKQNLERIENSFIEPGSPVNFLDYLEEGAGLTDVVIKVRPLSTELEPDDLWLSIGFRVNAGGSAENCLRFLEVLEQSNWLFEILQFNLQKVPEENPYYKEFKSLEPGDAYMSLVIKAYSGQIPTAEQKKQQEQKQ